MTELDIAVEARREIYLAALKAASEELAELLEEQGRIEGRLKGIAVRRHILQRLEAEIRRKGEGGV